MMELFHDVSQGCSKLTTERYSTSFSSAIRLLHRELRQPIYNIYGFVRFADEIVDTFHQHDKATLLRQFREDTYEAIEKGISLNPILHSFQMTVHAFNIDMHLIDAFLRSMEFDLSKSTYQQDEYREYIYGSAEAVGLMCLYVFCAGHRQLYEKLRPYARSLGAAFQKVNFLRDLKSDYTQLQRMYFPGVDFNNFNSCSKKVIEEDIDKDFQYAYKGILKLPMKARFGVYVAFKYYYSLFNEIRRTKPTAILQKRIRISNYRKALIVLGAGLRNRLSGI